MEDLRGKIRDEIEKLEEMIKANEDKEKIEKQRKNPEDILEKYLKGKTIKEIRREKEIIAKIVMDIKKENKLNDGQITKLLKIGKNRIKQLKKEGFIKEEIVDKQLWWSKKTNEIII